MSVWRVWNSDTLYICLWTVDGIPLPVCGSIHPISTLFHLFVFSPFIFSSSSRLYRVSEPLSPEGSSKGRMFRLITVYNGLSKSCSSFDQITFLDAVSTRLPSGRDRKPIARYFRQRTFILWENRWITKEVKEIESLFLVPFFGSSRFVPLSGL